MGPRDRSACLRQRAEATVQRGQPPAPRPTPRLHDPPKSGPTAPGSTESGSTESGSRDRDPPEATDRGKTHRRNRTLRVPRRMLTQIQMFTQLEECRVHWGSIGSRRRVGVGALPAGPWLLRNIEGEREVSWPVSVFAKDRGSACPAGRAPAPARRFAGTSARRTRATTDAAPRGARVLALRPCRACRPRACSSTRPRSRSAGPSARRPRA
jgi:hypothetical protein